MKKLIPEDSVLVPDQADCVFKGKIFDVYQWPQELFNGTKYTFEMLKRTDTAIAICVADNKILVVDDEQPHMGARRSFPGGRIDVDDASVKDAAQREILEETGYEFKNWRLIKVSQPYRKIEWFVYVFLAWEPAGRREVKLDPGEKISVQQLSFEELKTSVLQRKGYLGESSDIFEDVQTIDELLVLPEFSGKEVDR